MSDIKSKTLFGFPVVITDDAPKGEILCGRLPTWRDLLIHGSFEAAIEAQKHEWAKIKMTDNKQQEEKPLLCPECGNEIKPNEPHTACLDAVLARVEKG